MEDGQRRGTAPRGEELVGRYRAARRDPGLAVLEGFHALKHALRFGAALRHAVTPDREALRALAARLAPDVLPALTEVAEIDPDLFARLAPVPPATGVLALARRPPCDAAALLAARREAPLVLLERPSDLGNIGAVVRVAAAAGAAGVLAIGRHDPWRPAALRGAAGLHFALPVARLDALPDEAGPVVAFHPEGPLLGAEPLPPGAVLAFGAEREGLSEALLARAHRRLAIPMRAGVSSLNLATAVAVALYAWRLHRPPLPAASSGS